MKHINITPGDVLNIRLKPDLHCLAQMGTNHYLKFFDICNRNGVWSNIDLNEIKSVFCIFVAEKKLRPIIERILERESVIQSRTPFPRTLIAYNMNGLGRLVTSLVQLDEKYTSASFIVLKEELSIERDLTDICNYEFIGVFGDSEKIRDRLITYFETGRNWDESKNYIFPGVLDICSKKLPSIPASGKSH